MKRRVKAPERGPRGERYRDAECGARAHARGHGKRNQSEGGDRDTDGAGGNGTGDPRDEHRC